MHESQRIQIRSEIAVRLCGAVAALIGVLAAASWFLGYSTRLNASGAIVVKTNTALALFAGGTSMLLLAAPSASRAARGTAGILAACVLLLGLLTVSEHAVGWDLGIDELFAREAPNAPATVTPNRMGPLASTSFTLFGLGALALAAGMRRIVPMIGLAICVLMLMPAVGYVLRIFPFFSVPELTGIAWPTVIALGALGLALVAAELDGGPMALLLRNDEGGRLIRALLPPALLAPITVAALCVAGERAGLYSAVVGIGLFVIAMTLILTGTVFRYAARASRADHEQRRASGALRESEARFREMANDAPLMIWIADPNGNCTFLSNSWLKFAGQSSEAALGRSWLETVHPEDQAAARHAFAEAQSAQRPFRIEHRFRRSDGSECWVLNTVEPRFDTQRHFVGFVGSVVDISDRREAEEARALLAAIAQFSSDAMITKSLQGVITSWNQGAAQIFGYTAKEAIGQSIMLLVPSERRAEEEHILERLRAGERIEHFETVRVAKDGRLLDISLTVSPILDASGRISGASAVARDITARKRIEAALRDREEMFRTLADNISQLAWMADSSGQVFWYNQRWFDYTGMSTSEMRDGGWRKVHHPEHLERVVERMQRSWATGELWEDTFPIRGQNGEYRWFLSRAVPIRDERGRVVRWFGTNTDISERREIEAALTRARDAAEAAGRAKDQFLAVLSHELRTPLTPVQMAITALDADATLPAALRADLSMIRRNVELEIRLIDDLLDLSRIRFGKVKLRPRPLDLNELVGQACDDCRSAMREKRIHLAADLDPAIGLLSADPARLKQILWNVLRNATKFTPEGGSIEVSTARVGDTARIVVRDNGAGIAPDHLPRIFGAFEQPRGDELGGLGLGLAITRSLVELHGGKIVAESPGVDRGSSFTIELPAAAISADEFGATAADGVAEKPLGLKLLVVEDHADTVRLLKRLLEISGYSVRTATTVAEALAAAENAPFDVLVSDVGLPDGSGYDLMRQLLPRRSVRGIAMSGYGMDEDIRRSHDAGFAEHLVKPIDITQLEQALRRVAGKPRAE